MKEFFKYVFATAVGLIVTLLVFMLLSIIFIFGISASADAGVYVGEGSIAKINLNGSVSERAQESPLRAMQNLILGEEENSLGLNNILAAINEAKNNENIEGIYMKGDGLSAQPASLEAIRKALADFKECGKFIIAYGDNYSQGFYYLASLADKILVNPQGSIDWHGLAGTTMFYKEAMDKLGIDMQIFKVGTFKSAVEPYMLNSMSDANREQVAAFLNSIWNNFSNATATSRGISTDRLNDIANEHAMFLTAEQLVENRLADTLIYEANVDEYLKSYMQRENAPETYDIDELCSIQRSKPKDKEGNVIAVYYAYGEIDGSSSSIEGDEGINSAKVVKDLYKLKDDDDVKAVVLRVNSPGGSAYGSEQIWHAVTELKAEKPVIVSMGDYAASGGYYISCNATSIVAEASTLTGSIGIYGMMPNIQRLTDKIGINIQSVSTNEHADMGNIYRPMSESEKAKMQKRIENGYDLFITRCADGRGMSKAAIDSIGQGRVWTGEMAIKLGLVDTIGGLDTAIEIAKSAAEVEDYTLMTYPAEPSMMDMLKGLANVKAKAYFLPSSDAARIYNDLQRINTMQQRDPLQAIMPYMVDIR